MRRRALLCWEAGRGRGHLAKLERIAAELGRRGWTCRLAAPLHKLSAGETCRLPTVAAPCWAPPDAGEAGPIGSSATLTDILFDLGLASPRRTEAQIHAWTSLVDDADLIVADFAPGAVLAARGRVPCLVVGTGYSVPPRGLSRFPPLHAFHAPRVDETVLAAGVDAALRASGRTTLDTLAGALAGDANAACTVPLLDPYAAWREEPVAGPLLSAPARRRADGADGVFCYAGFASGAPAAEALVRALSRWPAATTAYVPNLGEAGKSRLRRAGIGVLAGPADIGEALARCRLVLHEGGHGIAASALLAGVPQVAMTTDIEKHLNAAALQRRGIAVALDASTLDAAVLGTAIGDALHDPVMLREAGRAAAEHADYAHRDVAATVADRCEALL